MQWFQLYCLPILLGILTTSLLFISKRVFFEVFLPRYREWIYRGLSIAGTWKARYPADRDPSHVICEEIMEVQQLADHVSGSISYAEFNVQGNSVIRQKQFEFEGTFIDSVLSAQYRNRSRADNGRGTFCLMAMGSEMLVGKYSWLDPDTRQVEASHYIWRREGGYQDAALPTNGKTSSLEPSVDSLKPNQSSVT